MHVHAGMTTTFILRTALILVTCTLVVMAVFFFIAGVACGHYLSRRWRQSANKNKQPESHNIESDLELKQNVAYITLHPTA